MNFIGILFSRNEQGEVAQRLIGGFLKNAVTILQIKQVIF